MLPNLKPITTVFACLLLSLGGQVVQAQSIVAAPDGTNTLVNINGQQFDITGGTLSGDGQNLFHSFAELGLSPGEIANFLANPGILNILGRVVGGNASVIDGLLQVSGSNANLFLINPAGVVFGPNSSLNVAGDFTATTATAIGFEAGWFNATGANDYSTLNGLPNQFAFATAQPGSVVNAGNLAVNDGQTLTLLGGTVVNTGTLSAPGGNITVVAVPGESRVRIQQTGMALSLEIDSLTAPVNPLGFNPVALPALLTSGNLQNATNIIVEADGTVRLTGSNIPVPVDAAGTVLISGQLNSAAPIAEGGTIHVLGDRIALIGASLDASGETDGGLVRVGGAYKGEGPLPNASHTFVSSDSLINVDAGLNGDGGRAIVWADDTTHFFGTITARGVSQSGNGGFVETSGKNYLDVSGASVDASSTNGNAGTWLLDPRNVRIVSGATAGGSFSGGNPNIFTPIADDATVAVADITGPLGGGTSVTITTGSSGNQEGDITVEAAINPGTVGGTVTLTLEAADDIFVNADIVDNDMSVGATLNVVLTAVDDIITTGRTISTAQTVPAAFLAKGGDVTFSAGGTIAAGSVNTSAMNGFGDASGGNVRFSAGGSITSTGTLNTAASGIGGNATAGSVTFNAGGTIESSSINATATASNSSVSASGGAVAFTGNSSINAGIIDASANATDISITDATALGGAVLVAAGSNPGSNIRFNTINTAAAATSSGIITASGGDVAVLATGTVQGTGTTSAGKTIDTEGTTANGRVTIQHDGGPNNLPFVIGDASQNGLAGSINGSVLSAGSFPVLPNGGSVAPTSGITVTSINESPSLTLGMNTLSIIASQTNSALSFSLADLAPSTADANRDNLAFIIDAILQGTLLRNGVALSAGDTISASDSLEYIPPDGVSGGTTLDAFMLRASDGVSTSDSQTIRIAIATVIPTSEETLPREIPLDPLKIAPPDREIARRIFIAERVFTQEFEGYLSLQGGEPQTLEEIKALLRGMERRTGLKPALIYAIYFRPTISLASAESGAVDSRAQWLKMLSARDRKQSLAAPVSLTQASSSLDRSPQATDRLELLLVTGDDEPVQRLLPGVTREEVQAAARNLVQAVTNPAGIRQSRYLLAAQQLYQWLVAPLEANLQAGEIDNLVFILDEGLRSLPLAALHNGQDFIVERYSVGLMPSLSLSDTRYEAIEGFQVLAAGAAEFPGQNQPPLPAVPVEVDLISGQLWTGESLLDQNFTFDRLERKLTAEPFGVIHLATHANFQSGAAENSYVQLWDRPISLKTLGTLPRFANDPPVELLVLSACRTAIGDREAELGFAGLAVQTGAKSALGSLWSVNDEGTMGLMTSFYEQLSQAPIKAEALKQAQLAMLRGDVRIEGGALVTQRGRFALPPELANQLGDRSLSHPYYWSAFTLIGSPW